MKPTLMMRTCLLLEFCMQGSTVIAPMELSALRVVAHVRIRTSGSDLHPIVLGSDICLRFEEARGSHFLMIQSLDTATHPSVSHYASRIMISITFSSARKSCICALQVRYWIR